MRKQMSPSEIRANRRYSIFDVKYLWALFITHKKWFALSVVACLFLAGAYIYFTRPSFHVQGKMKVISQRQTNTNTLSASTALLNQLPTGLSSSLNLGRSLGTENEKVILKTSLLSKDVVEELGLYTEYRLKRFLKSSLLYKNQPVDVKVSPECLQTMSDNLPLKAYSFRLTIDKDDKGYTIEGKLKKGKKKIEIEGKTFAKLPAVIHTEIGDLTFTENVPTTEEDRKLYAKDYQLIVTIVPPMTAAKQFVKRLTVESATKKATSILHINIQDENVLRGTDFVNSLVAHYNERSNQERQEEAAKNEEFINGRIAKIDGELGLTDADWEKVKKQYQVTDPKIDAEEVMGKKSAYESQIVNFGVQQQLLDYLSEYVNDPANRYELIPVNVGVYSGDAVSMISRHNQLVNERKMLLKSVTEQSTQVKLTTQLIDELHPVILTAFKRDRESLLLRKRVAEREYNRYQSRVVNSPEQERNMTEVSRQRTIKQNVFVSLLQKREQVIMELANTVDKGRLVDETQSLKKTKPRTKMALLASLLLGLLLPYVFIFIRRSNKPRIDSEIDLKLQTRLPLIGTIPASGQGDVDDAFRLIRNNLLRQLQEGRKTIMFTSANAGDGKTFSATHLAEAFNRMGEKSVCCNLLEVLPAGSAGSAHPADLLARKELRQAIDSLRTAYDIIILDGTELDPYNESLIDGLADVICFVCRSGKTTKAAIKRLEKINSDSRQSSVCMVLNQ